MQRRQAGQALQVAFGNRISIIGCPLIMKRDIQGKFALKNDDYRLVRSLRLTDETWLALGIAAECLGIAVANSVRTRCLDFCF